MSNKKLKMSKARPKDDTLGVEQHRCLAGRFDFVFKVDRIRHLGPLRRMASIWEPSASESVVASGFFQY